MFFSDSLNDPAPPEAARIELDKMPASVAFVPNTNASAFAREVESNIDLENSTASNSAAVNLLENDPPTLEALARTSAISVAAKPEPVKLVAKSEADKPVTAIIARYPSVDRLASAIAFLSNAALSPVNPNDFAKSSTLV